jgi:MFS superfamily sulfate permease-like transporter
VLIYRRFFANASYVKGRVREALHGAPASVRWLVFNAEALTHVDASGVHALKSLVQSLGEEGITFVFARLKSPMRQALREAGVLDLIGEPHVYPTVRAAVAAAVAGDAWAGRARVWTAHVFWLPSLPGSAGCCSSPG